MDYAPIYPIATMRLHLRPFTRGDIDAMYAYRQREDVTRFLSDPPLSRGACAEALQARIGQIAWGGEGDKIFLAVERRVDRAMIGEVSLILRDAYSRQGEIGYILHPDYHGMGYATEAAAALLAMGFEGAGLHRIHARCHARNDASRRVMERLGMRREAHFREHRFSKGAWEEELVYAMLEDEWRDRRR